MTLVQDTSSAPPWGEIAAILEARPRNRRESLMNAISAITDAHGAGHIDNEEVEALLKWVVVEALGPSMERIGAALDPNVYFGPHAARRPFRKRRAFGPLVHAHW